MSVRLKKTKRKKTINKKTVPAEAQHPAIIIDSSTLSRFCDAMRVIDSKRIPTMFSWPFDFHNFEDHSAFCSLNANNESKHVCIYAGQILLTYFSFLFSILFSFLWIPQWNKLLKALESVLRFFQVNN